MLSRIFKAFSYRDFRLLWMGACTSSIGTWMQQVAQSWLIFDISHNKFYLGLAAFLGEIPIFLFSLVGGVVADRMDRRKLLLASQIIQMSNAFILTALLFTGKVQIWHILVLSFLTGTAQSFGGPAYSALVPSLVETEDLPNAIALNSIQFNLARIIGPVIGGMTMKYLGSMWCFGLNGLSFLAVIYSLVRLHINFQPKTTSESILTSMKEGISFIRGRGAMVGLVGLAFCMTFLAIPMITFLPVFARDIFHKDSDTFTRFLACSGVGSVLGALFIAWAGNVKNKGKIALIMLALLGLSIGGFALSRSLFLSFALLIVSGAVLMGGFAMISSLVQLITTNEMRGRVMSIYNVAFRGGMPFGSLITGWLVQTFNNAPAVIAVNGAVLCAIGLYFLFFQRKVAEL